MTMTTDKLFDLMHQRGQGLYGLSAVTQLEHGLQSAALAAERKLGNAMIVAALLHDVGHLVVGDDVNLAAQGIDDVHEESGAGLLEQLYGKAVSEPVRMHVAAKRYLCAVDQSYYDKLGEDSKQSLEVQGGIMTSDEVAEFEQRPYYADAVELRKIDDEAKVPGLATPDLEAYRAMALRLEQG